MESRRAFLKKASMLAGAGAAVHILPASIARALEIEAEAGSTYLDAEHIVFLMQENRSFDHCFGSLQGVRGFNDPRAIQQAGGLPVWAQQNKQGETFLPFHLDIENTRSTWMGSLPHSWKDMVAARNNGKLDTWLEAKKAGNAAYRHMPLTMGYYKRSDLPFYYAFADAFTICDQHFCSSLTGTSANRSYFWSGTIREEPHDPDSVAHVDNGQINYRDVSWTTYPERLEKAGVSWKVYQNELSLPVGFKGEAEDWLANFTNNNLEFHRQYQVRFHPRHRSWMQATLEETRKKLQDALRNSENNTPESEARQQSIEQLQKQAGRLEKDLQTYSEENFQRLDGFSKAIHQKAFTTNTGDGDYHELENLRYTDQGETKTAKVPKGDVFYQFRKDVDTGKLPTVSWLVAPARFSDHPGSPWFGAWYVSEALDILTKNPRVWKKTIFILTYDENDGYFDHVPPFVPAHSQRPDTGKNPEGLDTREEYVTREQERLRTNNPQASLDSPIGLGFRVPMIVASPWSKGGWVNSEVLDLTSNLQFLEHFLEKKFGKTVKETNLSSWRRLVSGDMTSVFRPAGKQSSTPKPARVNRDAEVTRIYRARNEALPGDYRPLSTGQLDRLRSGRSIRAMPVQEKGTRPACALPYDIQVNARIPARKSPSETAVIELEFAYAGKLPAVKKERAAPFIIRALSGWNVRDSKRRPDSQYENQYENPEGIWNITVKAGDRLLQRIPLEHFSGAQYHFQVHGPNGFFREFRGKHQSQDQGSYAGKPEVLVRQRPGKAILEIDLSSGVTGWVIRELSYLSKPEREAPVNGKSSSEHYILDCHKSQGWYDLEISSERSGLQYRYAGHLETGQPGRTDPLMGGELS